MGGCGLDASGLG